MTEPKGCELLRGLLHVFGCREVRPHRPKPEILVLVVQIGPEEPDPQSSGTTARTTSMAEITQAPIAMAIAKGKRRQVIFHPLKATGEAAVIDGDPTVTDNLDDAVSMLVKDDNNGNMYFRGIGFGATSGNLLFDTRLGPNVNNIVVPYTITVPDPAVDEAATIDVTAGEEEDDPLAVV